MSEADVRPTFTYTIGGVRIEMPVKPYPSQVSMMDKVIRGCQKQQNCLLESPTGSGKTLALLCSALAWQRAEKVRLEKLLEQEFQQKLIEWQQKEQQKKQQKEKKQKKVPKSPEKKPTDSKAAVSPVKSKGWSSSSSSSAAVVTISDDEDEDMAVFKLPGKKRKKMNNSKSFNVSDVSNDSIMTNDSSLITEDEDEHFEPPQTETSKPPTKPKLVVPVIYFCTRTHKQIEQVVKELQRTSFNKVKSCVLASREFTCIQDSDILYPIKYKTKTELCKDLMDPKARRKNSLKYRMDIDKCVYYDNGGVKLSTYEQLARSGVQSVWDIEELVNLGRQKHSCPYFGSRLLLKTADIVFCPYNYIIDPVIRGTMKLKLQGHVIIVDEAHNIEDQCRDAASLKLDQINLNLAKMDCEKLSKYSVNPSSYAAIARYLSDMSKWIDKKSAEIKTYDDFNRSTISWSGTYTVASFEEFGIGFKAFEKLQKHIETVLADDSDEKENAELDETNGDDISSQSSSISEHNPNESSQKSQNSSNNDPDQMSDTTISNATKSMLTSICTVFNLFFDEKYRYDYHVSLEKVMEMKKFEHEKRATTGLDDWINSSAESKDSRQIWNNVLSFLCLNPGAVFHELKTAARSIILTSGTLSPMQSFQSELGTQFPIALEAAHVIKQQQCWVTSVSTGPTRVDLNGQYQNTNTYGFQDEMGQVLKNVCETVPYGVLCFMPSYQLMEKLYARWEVTGLLRDLKRIKVVMCEPRRGDQLEELMVKYYEAIKNADRPGRPSGALFLAVYRGKISEGLDFSDNNARAVVAVGIPYPNYKDVAVSHKKDYNNRHHKDRGLLSGWHWYQIQGYRALNQALGRCIRHKNDWGAILLVDSRYTQPSNLTGLSKWIRGRVEHGESWLSTMAKLKDFVVSRQQEDSTNKS